MLPSQFDLEAHDLTSSNAEVLEDEQSKGESDRVRLTLSLWPNPPYASVSSASKTSCKGHEGPCGCRRRSNDNEDPSSARAAGLGKSQTNSAEDFVSKQ